MSEHLVLACPECDKGGVRRRFPDSPNSTSETKYYCHRCGNRFDEPVERPSKQPGGLSGLARRLHDADREEAV